MRIFLATTTSALTTLALVLFHACAQRPTANRDFSSITFDHTNVVDSCIVCHEQDRPAPVNGVIHGDGQECVSCHTPEQGWRNATGFNHQPPPSECTSCHEGNRPSVDHGGGQDCIGCHQPGNNWTDGAGFDHTPLPSECSSCHEGARPAPVNGVAHGLGRDCVDCHQPGSSWLDYAGYTHSPMPSTCSPCHEKDRPATAQKMTDPNLSGIGHYKRAQVGGETSPQMDCNACHRPGVQFDFDHGDINNQDISFCLPCHYDDGDDKHGSGNPSWFQPPTYNYHSGNYGNCFDCHDKERRKWDQ